MFHDVRLPIDIERGAIGGGGFLTTVLSMKSGREKRNQNWQKSRGEWEIGYGTMETAELHTIRDFFYARRGRAFAFRFRDWSDYIIGEDGDPKAFAAGDGTTVGFQLRKVYEPDGPAPFYRDIVLPDVSTLEIYVNGVEQTTGWSINATTGLITFSSPVTDTHVIAAKGEFDTPVRFNNDNFQATMVVFTAGEIPQLQIVEVKEAL